MSKKQELEARHNEMVKVDITYTHIDDDLDKGIEAKHNMSIYEVIGQIFNVFEVEKSVKQLINPKLEYVVKFTPKLLEKMEKHNVDFLRDTSTGELLPDLYDYTKKGIGGKIRLELKEKSTQQDLASLSNAINNLLEQQRYEALVEEIRQLHIAAKRIERGQDNDRFAKVNAGRKHLLDALNYKGSEEEKKKMVLDAIVLLRDGRELIEKTLLDKLEALSEVPKGKIKRLWRCFTNSDYYDIQVGRYNDIQEYFQYYYMSLQPMAYAYTYLNQPQLVELLLEDSKKVFEHPKLANLITVEGLLPNEHFEGVWYRNSKYYKEKIVESYKAREDVYIVVNGKELLEVLDNGEAKRESKES